MKCGMKIAVILVLSLLFSVTFSLEAAVPEIRPIPQPGTESDHTSGRDIQ